MAATWWIAKSANAAADGPYTEPQVRRMIESRKWTPAWHASPGGSAPLRPFSEVFKNAIEQFESAEEAKRKDQLASQQKAEAERQKLFEENHRKQELERQQREIEAERAALKRQQERVAKQERELQVAVDSSSQGDTKVLRRHRLRNYIASELLTLFITAHIARGFSFLMILFFVFKVFECLYGIIRGLETSITDEAAGFFGASFNFYYLGLYIFMVGISASLSAITTYLIAWSRIAEEQGVLK